VGEIVDGDIVGKQVGIGKGKKVGKFDDSVGNEVGAIGYSQLQGIE